MGDGPRFAFHPLERRGLLLGLDGGQLLTMGGAALLALAAHAALGRPAGVVGAVCLAAAGILAALWTRDGRPLVVRALIVLQWVGRGAARPVLDPRPVSGHGPTPSGSGGAFSAGRHRLGGAHGVEILEHRGGPGEPSIGIVRDRRAGTWAGVVPVGGCAFSLMDAGQQAQRLEGWRRVLGALARPGSPVVRIQWVHRSWSGVAVRTHEGLTTGAGPQSPTGGAGGAGGVAGAAESYRRLLDSTLPDTTWRGTWLVVVVQGARPQAVTNLRRELRLLEGQLRAADLDPRPPLDGGDLTEVIGRPHRAPGAVAAGPPRGAATGPWPLAGSDRWSAYRADGSWHATYWISEWPRAEVGPDFLSPLLLGPQRAATSLIMTPVPVERALREARSARTADIADAELRARAGFLQSARRERETEGVARREAELADGHQEFHFNGFVTVSAGDPDELATACADLEHAAQSARLEVRRLFGRQAEAYTWTLPLGRGLR